MTSKTYIRLSESDQSYLYHLHVEDSINLNATFRYLMLIAYTHIYTIHMTAQAVKLLEHKLSHLD